MAANIEEFQGFPYWMAKVWCVYGNVEVPINDHSNLPPEWEPEYVGDGIWHLKLDLPIGMNIDLIDIRLRVQHRGLDLHVLVEWR